MASRCRLLCFALGPCARVLHVPADGLRPACMPAPGMHSMLNLAAVEGLVRSLSRRQLKLMCPERDSVCGTWLLYWHCRTL